MGMELAADKPEQEDYAAMEDVEFTDTDLYFHVRQTLKSALQGDPERYNQLVMLISSNQRLVPEEAALLETGLKGLSGSVSSLDKVRHGSLLDSIFSMNMWNYGIGVMDALIDLVVSLATSSGKYVDECLQMLVANFIPPVSWEVCRRVPANACSEFHSSCFLCTIVE